LNHSGGGRLQIGSLARSHGSGGTNGLAFFFATILLLPLTNNPVDNSKDSAITNDIDVIVVVVVIFILFLVNSLFSPSQKCYLGQKCCNNIIIKYNGANVLLCIKEAAYSTFYSTFLKNI
jgi:hypothetical protein